MEICGNPPEYCQVFNWTGDSGERFAKLVRPDGSVVWNTTPALNDGNFYLDGGEENITGFKIYAYANLVNNCGLYCGEYVGTYVMPDNGGGNRRWVEMVRYDHFQTTANLAASPYPLPCYDRMNLVWDYEWAREISGFLIEKKTGSQGAWTELATVGSGVRSYSDYQWQVGSTYYYRIRAFLTIPINSRTVYMDYSNETSVTLAPVQVHITLNQQRQNTTRLSGTTIGRWQGSSFDEVAIPDLPFPLPEIISAPGQREVVRGYQQVSETPLEKYRVWKRGGEDQLDTVQNHRGFTVTCDLGELSSTFYPTQSSVIIKTGFVDAPGITGGNIQFHDPWYIDYEDPLHGSNWRNRGMQEPRQFYTRSVGESGWQPDFTTTYPEGPFKYNGAFLNQPIVSGQPYYSVGAPNPNTINNFTSYFLNWEGSSVSFQNANAMQTAVVFTNSEATATAKYKAHLGSSLSNATGSNSQRVLSANGFVYESAGSVWCGYRGAGEVKASNGSSSAPSLVRCADNLYFVFRSNANNEIMYADANFPSYTPLPISTNSTTAPDARPVITDLGDFLYAFWEGPTEIRYNQGARWEWPADELVGGTEGCGNPSVSATASELYLTYDNGDDVFIFDHPNYLYAGEVPASVKPASHNSQVYAEDGEQAHVVWEAFGPLEWGQRVMYQHVAKDIWGDAHEFRCSSPTVDFQNPTVSSSGSPVWAWDDGSSTYKAVFNDGGTWKLSEVYADITQPNFATDGTGFISTSTSGPPYRLVMVDETIAGPQASVIPEQYSRSVVVARKPSHRPGHLPHTMGADESPSGGDGLSERDTSSYISVELLPLTLKMRDGSVVSVDFATVADSIRDERLIWGALTSQPITLQSGIDSIIINGEADAVEPNLLAGVELGLSFDLVDADRGTVVKRIGTEIVFTGNGRGSLIRREKLVGVAGRRVFLRPTIRGFAGRSANLVSTVVHVHTLLMDSTSNPVSPLAKAGEGRSMLPTEFALHQNYPNPFNPATEIRFDLPEAGNVSLSIFDVLGKKVAELANGYREAGYHSATWNATGQASGVYFARFNVTSAEGKTSYSKVNKLVLVR